MQSPEIIMLVDDDSITNFIHERLIKKLGVAKDVIIRSNGKEAFIFLRKHLKKQLNTSCLILLDLNMPGINGFDFIRQFKKLKKSESIRLAVVTTSQADIDINQVKELGSFPYINKPLTSEKIYTLLKEKN
jgi:CheY-like chemotaxis protein